MTTIIVKNSGRTQPTAQELLNIDLHDDNPSKRTLPELLIKVGQKLIEHGHHQEPEDWLSVSQVAALLQTI